MFYELLRQQKLSPNRYISGQPALNILDLKYHTGDWHQSSVWNESKTIPRFGLMGDGEPDNTNAYLGDAGIIDATEILRKMGKPPFAPIIYAASHARAIADMIICHALDHKLSLHNALYDLNAWMPTTDDKERVYKLLRIAKPLLPEYAACVIQQFLDTAEQSDFDE